MPGFDMEFIWWPTEEPLNASDDDEDDDEEGTSAELAPEPDADADAGGRLALPSAGTLIPPRVEATVPLLSALERVPGPGCATTASSAGVDVPSAGKPTPQHEQTLLLLLEDAEDDAGSNGSDG